MNKKILLKKLEDAKVIKDKKWLYSYTKWLLKQKDLDYNKLQVRINLCFYQSEGRFKNYYRELNDKDKVKYSRRQVAKRKTNDKLMKKQKLLASKQRKIFRLYRDGELSKKSSLIIDKKIRG